MLALFSFLAISFIPTLWIAMLCKVIVRYFSDILKKRYREYEFSDLIFAGVFLFLTIPAYAHLLLRWRA